MESMVLKLLAVAVLLAFLTAIWLLKRQGLLHISRGTTGSMPGTSIRVISRRPLTGQHVLFLVDVAGKVMLIATAPGSCQILERFDSFHNLRTQQ